MIVRWHGRLVISTGAQTAQPGERLLPEEVVCFAPKTLEELGGEMELLVRHLYFFRFWFRFRLCVNRKRDTHRNSREVPHSRVCGHVSWAAGQQT